MALRLSTGLRNKLAGINLNKITNGEFTTDTTGWTAINAVLSSESGGQSGNHLKVLTNSANVAKAYQDITTMKVDHMYVMYAYGKNTGGASGGRVMVGTVADEDAIFESADMTQSAAWVEFYADVAGLIVFKATATTHRFTLQNSDTSDTAKFFGFDTIKLISLSRALQDIFHKGFVKLYSGTQPALADNAPVGNLLVTIYSDGAAVGLSFDDASNGTLSKKSTETWSGSGVYNPGADALSFRLIAPGDGGGSSTTDERIDGSVGTSGAELNMGSTYVALSAVISISTFQLTVPAQ